MEFVIADATILEGYAGRLATVIDVGLYQGLTAQQRTAYLTAVHRACQPAALLHMVCISDAMPLKFLAPYEIDATTLRDSLTSTSGWAVRGLKRTTLTTAFTRYYIEQQAGSAAREAFDRPRLVYDQQGRLIIPAGLATVERL